MASYENTAGVDRYTIAGIMYLCGIPGGCDYKSAQSFQLSSAATISSAQVYAKHDSDYTDSTDLRVSIQTDMSGVPSGISITGGETTIPAFSQTNYAWKTATFSGNPQVSTNTKYWIVLDYSGGSGNRMYDWALDDQGTYANGAGKYYDHYTNGWGAGNMQATSDFLFIIQGTSSNTPPTASRSSPSASSVSATPTTTTATPKIPPTSFNIYGIAAIPSPPVEGKPVSFLVEVLFDKTRTDLPLTAQFQVPVYVNGELACRASGIWIEMGDPKTGPPRSLARCEAGPYAAGTYVISAGDKTLPLTVGAVGTPTGILAIAFVILIVISAVMLARRQSRYGSLFMDRFKLGGIGIILAFVSLFLAGSGLFVGYGKITVGYGLGLVASVFVMLGTFELSKRFDTVLFMSGGILFVVGDLALFASTAVYYESLSADALVTASVIPLIGIVLIGTALLMERVPVARALGSGRGKFWEMVVILTGVFLVWTILGPFHPFGALSALIGLPLLTFIFFKLSKRKASTAAA